VALPTLPSRTVAAIGRRTVGLLPLLGSLPALRLAEGLVIRAVRWRVISGGKPLEYLLARHAARVTGAIFRVFDETRLSVSRCHLLPIIEYTFLISPIGFPTIFVTQRG